VAKQKEQLPDWTQKLPGIYRILQPHEQVQAGDYLQIGQSYALICQDDWMLPHYRPSGRMYGTFWRRQN
jgi:hypothetical protein